MSEIICIHVGQAGIQVGNACWEAVLQLQSACPSVEETPSSWQQMQGYIHLPQSAFVVLASTVVDEMRTGTYRQLTDLGKRGRQEQCRTQRLHLLQGDHHVMDRAAIVLRGLFVYDTHGQYHSTLAVVTWARCRLHTPTTWAACSRRSSHHGRIHAVCSLM